METVRYLCAIIIVCGFPPAVLYWFFVHPLAPVWRRLPFWVSGSVLAAIVLGIFMAVALNANRLIGTNMTTSIPLVVLSVVVILLSVVIDVLVHRHLSITMLLGYNEINPDAPRRLLTEGMYAYSRNPRYLAVMVGAVGWSMLANYSGTYLICGASIVALLVIARLEERDLETRFGQQYRDYRNKVPFLLPLRFHR